ncbi:hypothetical protein ACIHFB_00140 [Streptomyces sp. NPDC051963]
MTELDDAEWATPPPLPPCTAKPLYGPQGAPTGPGAKAVRHGLRDRRIMPVISHKGAPNIKGLGKLRYVVE